jgi:hypothetical protein
MWQCLANDYRLMARGRKQMGIEGGKRSDCLGEQLAPIGEQQKVCGCFIYES